MTYEQERLGSQRSFILFKQVPWYHHARFALEQTQLTIRTPFLDNDLVRLAFQAPSDPKVNREIAHLIIADGNPFLSKIPTDRGAVGNRSSLLGYFRRVYQESMVRAENAYDYGMPDWLARIDAALHFLNLERLFLGRHKYYHFRSWYRNELAQYVRDYLLDDRTLHRPYLRGSQVEKCVLDHIDGKANNTTEISRLLTLEIIQRQLIERL